MGVKDECTSQLTFDKTKESTGQKRIWGEELFSCQDESFANLIPSLCKCLDYERTLGNSPWQKGRELGWFGGNSGGLGMSTSLRWIRLWCSISLIWWMLGRSWSASVSLLAAFWDFSRKHQQIFVANLGKKSEFFHQLQQTALWPKAAGSLKCGT